MDRRQVAKNVLFSLVAQLVSFSVSLITGLIVPKFIDELQYAYWQMYMLYVGYVGILHFGIIDGLCLRYSQYDYDKLDKDVVRSQFYILLALDTVLGVIVVLLSKVFFKGVAQEVAVYVAIGIVTKNLYTYTSYMFQITNRIKKYSILVILHRFFYGLAIVAGILMRIDSFAWICIADLCCDCFAIIYGIFYSRELYIGKTIEKRIAFEETLISASAGIFVLFANWSSNLIIGSGKMIVQWHWDGLMFGKMSFAFSISNVFLTFIGAISVVLFPSLKRMNENELPELYSTIRNAISPILFIALLFYYPGYLILDKWLPAYRISLSFLGMLLPMIVYTTKVNLLTNNYLKAYRKEKQMLYINLISIVIAVVLYLISAYVFDNITLLLVCIVAVLMFKSVISEVVVGQFIHVNLGKDIVGEFIMTVVFIISSKIKNMMFGFFVYFFALGIYLFVYRKSIKNVVKGFIRQKA